MMPKAFRGVSEEIKCMTSACHASFPGLWRRLFQSPRSLSLPILPLFAAVIGSSEPQHHAHATFQFRARAALRRLGLPSEAADSHLYPLTDPRDRRLGRGRQRAPLSARPTASPPHPLMGRGHLCTPQSLTGTNRSWRRWGWLSGYGHAQE
jgi:hypothetical protein